MLQTQRLFAENIIHFYVDEEVIGFLNSETVLMAIYDEMLSAEGKATVYPLVIPLTIHDYEFDLMMIIKHERATDNGQWEIYVAKNFVMENTNLISLFRYIEIATNADAKHLLQGIQHELRTYREKFNLLGKTTLLIDGEKKEIAFGVSAV